MCVLIVCYKREAPQRHRAGSSGEKLSVFFSSSSELATTKMGVSVSIGEESVHCHSSACWMSCVAGEIYLEPAWLFAVAFIEEMLTDVNG